MGQACSLLSFYGSLHLLSTAHGCSFHSGPALLVACRIASPVSYASLTHGIEYEEQPKRFKHVLDLCQQTPAASTALASLPAALGSHRTPASPESPVASKPANWTASRPGRRVNAPPAYRLFLIFSTSSLTSYFLILLFSSLPAVSSPSSEEDARGLDPRGGNRCFETTLRRSPIAITKKQKRQERVPAHTPHDTKHLHVNFADSKTAVHHAIILIAFLFPAPSYIDLDPTSPST